MPKTAQEIVGPVYQAEWKYLADAIEAATEDIELSKAQTDAAQKRLDALNKRKTTLLEAAKADGINLEANS